MAELTIGMPVYNNAATLAAALDSLLAQTFADFRIVISDDASSDETAAIAHRYAERDDRISYVRQARNLGYYGNYKFVLDRADTPFFMWAAGDDRWEPTFVEANLTALRRDANLVASVSRVRFGGDAGVRLATGTYPLRGAPKQRMARYLAGCGACDMSRLFSIFRTDALRSAFPIPESFSFDVGLCAAVLLRGEFNEVPETLMVRDKTPAERYLALMHKEAGRGLASYFPGLRATRWLLRERRIPLSARIVLALLAFNVDWHLAYTERYCPRYLSLTRPGRWLWQRHVGWRLRAARG
jgi:glycosyltransferase involved in cell wall biosynthesis